MTDVQAARRAPATIATRLPRASPQPHSFYDGPPFATGLPHYGNLLAGVLKRIGTAILGGLPR